MLTAICFYDQSLLEGHEVDDVGAYRLLPPELETTDLLAPQYRPKSFLSVGLPMTKLTSQGRLRSSTHVFFHSAYWDAHYSLSLDGRGLGRGLTVKQKERPARTSLGWPSRTIVRYRYVFNQGIMARNSLPTCSMGWLASRFFMALKVGRPAWFSRIHSLAKLPS